MTYGTIHKTTEELLVKRATESGIDVEKLGLEPDFDQWYNDAEEIIKPTPDNLYEISVIFGGALDENFYVVTDYEVNIADWIAEQCRAESLKQGGELWEITVTEYAFEDAGAVRYRVTDESGV